MQTLIRALAGTLALVGLPAAAADPIVGHWYWIEKQTLVIKEDGSIQLLKGKDVVRRGRWSSLKDTLRYTLQWEKDGAKETCEVSPDGYTLTTATADGITRRGEKLDEADAKH